MISIGFLLPCNISKRQPKHALNKNSAATSARSPKPIDLPPIFIHPGLSPAGASKLAEAVNDPSQPASCGLFETVVLC